MINPIENAGHHIVEQAYKTYVEPCLIKHPILTALGVLIIVGFSIVRIRARKQRNQR